MRFPIFTLILTLLLIIPLVSGLAEDPDTACDSTFLWFRTKHEGSKCAWKARDGHDIKHKGRCVKDWNGRVTCHEGA
ncbi:hypothetical protein BDV96DRAFT_648287 [Lophiotrema nucula]|uniref:Uncharacterized protein n=1 Tax=Lophiotrema nucula TaxID=690887 RepID=A0A6A5Z4S6_9PLEO|nr:hypothetical protein BDV96DRAFT_648287 [Lophiotrema nucula]